MKNARILKDSIIEKALKKKSGMRDNEMEKHKFDSLKLSIFIGLFGWLILGVIIRNIFLSAAISTAGIALVFILLLQLPLAKKKAYSKKVEAELPLFLMKLSAEIKLGKNFYNAIEDCCKEKGFASKEFEFVIKDMNKGATFQEALQKMNERTGSMNIKRACSNLSNLQIQGSRDTAGLKKLAQELLLKQRIESKEFSGKMVVYALVFIAISAIVPAMFQSFVLIGSYFMKLNFSPQEIFLISVALFPVLDLGVLFLIDSKTPLFLKG